jgi:DNA-binding NtrC family response regulator
MNARDLAAAPMNDDEATASSGDQRMIGRSREMLEVRSLIGRVARSNCTVLFTGESGTGKEVAVTLLHELSARAGKPLVTVNCGAIPEALLESELFGHQKGAFTGAHAARQGRVAAAEGGTLFLDEVGELPLLLQVKLLRLLQQREYSPVGDSNTRKCDIRIVAATNRDLGKDVAAGRFREDLYYRLNIIHIILPPLRDRSEDLDELAAHFFRTCAARAGREDLTGLSLAALSAIRAYDWPGNVRALENAVERAVLLAVGPEVRAEDLPPQVLAGGATRGAQVPLLPLPDLGIDLRSAVEQYENQLILQALERTGWNKQRAAQLLKVNRTTLIEMLKRKRLTA